MKSNNSQTSAALAGQPLPAGGTAGAIAQPRAIGLQPARSQIIRHGSNCWVQADAEAAGVLIDGNDYYRAFYQAAQQARQYILIAGWKFHSDVRLMRGRDAQASGKEVKFQSFLAELCARNPDLEIYILAWNYSVVFSLEWEWFQQQKFENGGLGRIHFRYDSNHAVGASHHQKFVVIDGRFAFVGGLDFNADDWDDRWHLAYNPDRADSGHKPHPPYHDAQAYVAGPAAAQLAVYFQQRWQAGTGEPIPLAPVEHSSDFRPDLTLALPPGPVAISRNEPFTFNEPRNIVEIRQLYLDAIDAAEELIYIENQYFSSQIVFQALQERMKDRNRPQLEIVIVLPRRVPAWTEAAIHGPPKLRMLEALRETAAQTGHQLGFYYSLATGTTDPDIPVTIHTKILIVDDRFLSVGSANTSNRSMGLDTELNVSWEAVPSGETKLVESIRRVRTSLLTEHCGWPDSPSLTAQLKRAKGLVKKLDSMAASGRCRLGILTPEVVFRDREWLKYLHRWSIDLDPGQPLIDENLFEALSPVANGWSKKLLGWLQQHRR